MFERVLLYTNHLQILTNALSKIIAARQQIVIIQRGHTLAHVGTAILAMESIAQTMMNVLIILTTAIHTQHAQIL